MNAGLFTSLLINVLVGVYLAWFYPRTVRRNFATGNIPRLFAILVKVMPPVGMALVVGSILYGILAAAGAFGG